MVVVELRLSRIRPSTLMVLKNRQSCNNNLKKKHFFENFFDPPSVDFALLSYADFKSKSKRIFLATEDTGIMV